MLLFGCPGALISSLPISTSPGHGRDRVFLEQMPPSLPRDYRHRPHPPRPRWSRRFWQPKLGIFDYLQKVGGSAGAYEVAGARWPGSTRKSGRSFRAHGRRSHGPGVLLATPVQGFYGIISQNPAMRDIFELIQTIADSYANVLIHGETGDGQGTCSPGPFTKRAGGMAKPFVTLDCTAVGPRAFLESELFRPREGRLYRCSGSSTWAVFGAGRMRGTLFLDEVATINLKRASEASCACCRRAHSNAWADPNQSRSMCGSSRRRIGPLEACVAEGSFSRGTFIHRLNVVPDRVCHRCASARWDNPTIWRWNFLRRFSPAERQRPARVHRRRRG